MLLFGGIATVVGAITYCLAKSRCTKCKTPCMQINNSPEEGVNAPVSRL